MNEFKVPFHWESTFRVAVSPHVVFAFLDDHQQLAGHMEKPSMISLLRVWIDYDWPVGRWERWIGRLLGKTYADWCVQRMATDAKRTFSERHSDGNQ